MSSMRNAVARRPHKERSQPQSRQKWGLLEKHKDYSLRAKDYNTKKEKLAILSQKSREKHPDEFAFGMLSSAQGKLGRRGDENRLSHDAVQLLKTQDAGYLRTVAQRNRREVEQVQEEVGLDGIMKSTSVNHDGRKITFDQDGEPVRKKRKTSSSGQSLDRLDDEGLNLSAIRPTRTSMAGKHEDTSVTAPTQHKSKKQLEREKDKLAHLKLARKKRQRLEEMRKAKLDVLKKRQREIIAAANALDLQRAKMAKVIGGTNKNGVKFKVRERKR